MQKSIGTVLKISIVLASMFLLSCQSELDKYYKIPDWLKGNAYQLLESKGNYTLFLEAVDLSGYKDMISGKGIITVMAPSDEAFQQYLSSKGYNSVSDIPVEELKKLVGFHLVYYAFDKEKFANYRPEGFTDTKVYSDAGLYYKFRTKSTSQIREFTDRTTAPGLEPKKVKVYHKERFLPVLSSHLFETKQIDAARNYTYFYPGTEWKGDGGNFCVSNANVEEYALVTDNGYVYTISKVLDPLETIYTELEKIGTLSQFRQLYDKFQDFQLNQSLTTSYGNGEDIYLYYHTDLPKIASEWTYNGEAALADYADLATLAKKAYNVFAPTDQSLQQFFNQFWAGYYQSITDVPFLPVKYLLDNHVYEGDVVFPEEIEKGNIKTKYGNPINFNTNDVAVKKMCVNGTLYGLNNLMIPSMFQSVTGLLFQDPELKIFLHMTDQTQMMLPLASSDLEFHMFMPSDRAIETNTTLEGNGILYQNLNPNKFGQQNLMVEGDQGYVNMSLNAMNTFVRNHIANRLMTTVGNKKVYKTMNSFQYLMVEDDARAYSSHVFNNYQNTPSVISHIKQSYNGKSYKIDSENSMALIPDFSLFKEQITKNTPAGFEKFKELVEQAQLHLQSPPFNFLLGDRFIVFVPTNEALEAGAAKIPKDNQSELIEYLKYYFVNVSQSSLNDYPFPGAGIQGTLSTFKNINNRNAKLSLIDTGNGLMVRDEKGKTVNVVGVFPRIYSDGAAYVIDGLLDLE